MKAKHTSSSRVSMECAGKDRKAWPLPWQEDSADT